MVSSWILFTVIHKLTRFLVCIVSNRGIGFPFFSFPSKQCQTVSQKTTPTFWQHPFAEFMRSFRASSRHLPSSPLSASTRRVPGGGGQASFAPLRRSVIDAIESSCKDMYGFVSELGTLSSGWCSFGLPSKAIQKKVSSTQRQTHLAYFLKTGNPSRLGAACDLEVCLFRRFRMDERSS